MPSTCVDAFVSLYHPPSEVHHGHHHTQSRTPGFVGGSPRSNGETDDLLRQSPISRRRAAERSPRADGPLTSRSLNLPLEVHVLRAASVPPVRVFGGQDAGGPKVVRGRIARAVLGPDARPSGPTP